MQPTRLLVSVRCAAEAAAALAGGADIIDVKEPGHGALGRADERVMAEVVAVVARRVPVSIALGDLCDIGKTLPRLPGVAWAKLGYRPSPQQREQVHGHWLNAEYDARPAQLVPVFYADAVRLQAPDWESTIGWFSQYPSGQRRRGGILLDTAIKDGQGLLRWYSLEQLNQLHRRCQESKMFLALAGSLSQDDVNQLMNHVRPEIIAVRGAACEQGDRGRSISTAAVAALKAIIQASSPA